MCQYLCVCGGGEGSPLRGKHTVGGIDTVGDRPGWGWSALKKFGFMEGGGEHFEYPLTMLAYGLM